MANRSYLYSTDRVPEPGLSAAERGLVGISEWAYAIPIAYKLLLSGSPRTCRSSIWKVPEDIALLGSYEEGLQRLTQFLERISNPLVAPLREEALQFLSAPTNRRAYFVLECGEIFELEDDELPEQNARLLTEIQNLDRQVEEALASVAVPTQDGNMEPGLLRRPFGAGDASPKTARHASEAVEALGLGNWSNVLYFSFDES